MTVNALETNKTNLDFYGLSYLQKTREGKHSVCSIDDLGRLEDGMQQSDLIFHIEWVAGFISDLLDTPASK